ncbi:MAG: hypothetical protein IJY12_01145, partial [Clostridia bacterium]|nr:hypothetical protein [Clostridia bacterium]
KNAALRTVQFSSATSGISSEAGFTLGKNNDGVLGTPYIAYRLDGAGDNKLYVPMMGSANVTVPTASGTTTKTQPAVGDTWEISCFYKIDYVNPAN